MNIIGIDPGATGAVAFLIGNNRSSVLDMSLIGSRVDAMWLFHLLVPYGESAHVYIEKSQPMPKQGISSTFNYGVTYGIIIGVVSGIGMKYTEVPAAKWKKAMGLGNKAYKDKSRAEACRLWPDMHEELKRKKDHNRAEALLLAEYGRRELVRLGIEERP